MTQSKFIALGLLAIVACSCADEVDPEIEKKFFTRIYDNNKFNVSYNPLDVKQTSDGGYLVLASRRLENSNFKGIYVMRTDSYGAFISDEEIKSDEVIKMDLVNPTPSLLELNGKFYFFCMNPVGLQTQLVEMDEKGEITATENIGGSYPSAAAMDGDQFLLLNYEISTKESVISKIDSKDFSTVSRQFSIGAGDAVEGPIINHFLRTGRQFPFLVGKTTSGQYYFNGFYNYTLSLVFTDLVADDPIGVIQGQQDDGGISALLPLTSGKYAVSRFNFGDNYFLPSVSLGAGSPPSSISNLGHYMPELTPESPVVIRKITLNGKDMLLYGCNTKGKQIALFGYDPTDGSFKGSKYIGFSNTFEIAALTPTKDDGIIICGTTYLAGRFPRICLFKLPSSELLKSFSH